MCKTTQVLWTSTPTTQQHYVFPRKPRPGVLRPGGSHRKDHRLPLHLYLHLRQRRRQHPRLHRRRRKPATGSNHYAIQPGVTRAVTRSHVRSPVATDYRANWNNRAAVSGLFQTDTLQQVHKLRSHANLDIAHQLDDTFGTEYAYATTNTQGSFSEGEIKEQILTTFEEAMGLPQVARWKTASDRYTASLEKHGVYELAPVTRVLAGQRVVSTRCVTIKQLLNKLNKQ